MARECLKNMPGYARILEKTSIEEEVIKVVASVLKCALAGR